MSDRMTPQRVPALLDALAGSGHITDRQALETFLLARQGETDLPLHIRVLVGAGAVIACVCFIAFLVQIELIDFDDHFSLLVGGLAFVAAAIGLNRLPATARAIAGSFSLQASFAAMATGKMLLVFGFHGFFDTGWAVSLGALIVTAATYHVFRMSIDRFLSSFVVLLSVLFNIVWSDDFLLRDATMREPLLVGFFGLLLAAAAVLLTHGRIGRDYMPLAYATALSLCATVLYPLSYGAISGPWGFDRMHPLFANAFLAGGLIALFAWVAGSVDTLKRPPMLLASLGAVLLGLISASGAMLSIGLMIVGYARHDKPLLVLGTLLMPAFLWLYYYGLDVSLLAKSLILTASGIVLLAGRVYMSYRMRSSET